MKRKMLKRSLSLYGVLPMNIVIAGLFLVSTLSILEGKSLELKKDVVSTLGKIGCGKGHSVYKQAACMNLAFEYRENMDKTLSCYDNNLSIKTKWKHVEGVEGNVLFISCGSLLDLKCDTGFNIVNEVCLNTQDGIILSGDEYVCANRGLRYYVANLYENNISKTEHFICKPRPHIIETNLDPANVKTFIKHTELLGDAMVAVPRAVPVNDINLLQKGVFIAVTTKKIGLVALSDILYIGKDGLDEYKTTVTSIRELLKHIKINPSTRTKLKLTHIKNPKDTVNSMVRMLEEHIDIDDVSLHNMLVNALTTLTLDIRTTLQSINVHADKDVILDYILEEYYHTYKLLALGSKSLEEL